MGKPFITIGGQEVTGLQSERAFMEWALAVEQENDKELLAACNYNICGLNVCDIWQKAVYGKNVRFMGLLSRAGIEVIATDYSPGLGWGYLTKYGFFGGYDTEAEAMNVGRAAQIQAAKVTA